MLCADREPCSACSHTESQSSRLFLADVASALAGPGDVLGSTHLLQPGLTPLKPQQAALQALQQGFACIPVPAPGHLRECLCPRDSRAGCHLAWTECFCSPWPAQHHCQQLWESPRRGTLLAEGADLLAAALLWKILPLWRHLWI